MFDENTDNGKQPDRAINRESAGFVQMNKLQNDAACCIMYEDIKWDLQMQTGGGAVAGKNTMRLDKLLTMLGEGTRAQVKDYVRAGRVTVNGVPARDSGMQVDAEHARVCLNGRALEYKAVRHVMMNKPQGTLTAARDKKQKTVMDLLPPLYAAMDCMPAGRLDKDTEGLLIITSDGQLAHRIISPKKDVTKVYFARVDGVLGEQDIAAFAAGLHIKDSDGEFDAKPAGLEIVSTDGAASEVRVRVSEGKYHQVKRMLASRGAPVVYLKRLQIGALKLDSALEPGQWREMTDDEVLLLEQE